MKSDLSPGPSLKHRGFTNPVREELAQVELMLQSYTSTAYPLIDEMNQYLHTSGGKRLRPAVLLLVSKLCDTSGNGVIKLATVVELIHVATLVHDDVIDKADLRRGRPSANARWGNEAAVLMGDWMYMTAFQMALSLRNLQVLDILIDLTRTMVTGEMMQLDLDGKAGISVKEQMDICFRKTAQLFSACARLPAVLAGCPDSDTEKLGEYGRALGMAFQLTDDMLDYTADETRLGKPVLKDLDEGKVTLPIILLLDKADSAEREFISKMARRRGQTTPREKENLLDLVEHYGTLPQIRDIVREYTDVAVGCLEGFPESPARASLMQLPEYILNRME